MALYYLSVMCLVSSCFSAQSVTYLGFQNRAWTLTFSCFLWMFISTTLQYHRINLVLKKNSTKSLYVYGTIVDFQIYVTIGHLYCKQGNIHLFLFSPPSIPIVSMRIWHWANFSLLLLWLKRTHLNVSGRIKDRSK